MRCLFYPKDKQFFISEIFLWFCPKLVRRVFDISSGRLRLVFEISSAFLRDLFGTASGHLREFFDCCSAIVRLRVEEQSKDSRSAAEGRSKVSRTGPGAVREHSRSVAPGMPEKMVSAPFRCR